MKKNRLIAGVTLTAFLSLSTPIVASPLPVPETGVVVSSEGDVRHGEHSIQTGNNGTVTIALPSGSFVRFAPNSEFHLVEGKETSEVYLMRGRLMASVQAPLTIRTFRSNAVATKGEFVLETSSTGTGLHRFHGDANLVSNLSEEITFSKLNELDQGVDAAKLAFGPLAFSQSVGEPVTFGAQDRGQPGAEDDDDDDDGMGDLNPDQDISNPGRTDGTTDTPRGQSTVNPSTPPAGGPSSNLWTVLGIGGLIGVVAALLGSGGSDDDSVIIPPPPAPVPPPPPVPSPSLP